MINKPLSVIIIVNETGFYHPKFVKNLLEKLNDQEAKILVGLVTKTKKTNSIEYYLFRNMFYLSIKELFILTGKVVYYKCLKNLLCYFKIFLSVELVLKKMGINYFYVENDINKLSYLKIMPLRLK